MSIPPSVTDVVDQYMLALDNEKSHQNVGWEMQPIYWLQSPIYHLSGCRCLNAHEATTKKKQVGSNGFKICLDVQNFSPNEITVKTIYNFIEVNAKHNDRKDEHRYRLPMEFNIEDVVSSISSDGVLTIQALFPTTLSAGREVRDIRIQHTGPVRSNVIERMECFNGKDDQDAE